MKLRPDMIYQGARTNTEPNQVTVISSSKWQSDTSIKRFGKYFSGESNQGGAYISLT